MKTLICTRPSDPLAQDECRSWAHEQGHDVVGSFSFQPDADWEHELTRFREKVHATGAQLVVAYGVQDFSRTTRLQKLIWTSQEIGVELHTLKQGSLTEAARHTGVLVAFAEMLQAGEQMELAELAKHGYSRVIADIPVEDVEYLRMLLPASPHDPPFAGGMRLQGILQKVLDGVQEAPEALPEVDGPSVTLEHIRGLLAARQTAPVLYVKSNPVTETSGDYTLDVWDAAYVPPGSVVVHRHEVVDGLGEGPDKGSIAEQLPEYQKAVDTIVAASEIARRRHTTGGPTQ